MPKITGRKQMVVKVSGNKQVGFRLSIPLEVYLNAMQPERYSLHACEDGTLVYQPVHP